MTVVGLDVVSGLPVEREITAEAVSYTHLDVYKRQYMIIDSSSRRNLELVETMREKQKRGSLLWVLDKTKTCLLYTSRCV